MATWQHSTGTNQNMFQPSTLLCDFYQSCLVRTLPATTLILSILLFIGGRQGGQVEHNFLSRQTKIFQTF